MLCYRDTTFCGAEECQSFTGCPRALTKSIHDKAKASILYIAQFADPKGLDCYNPKPETGNRKHEDTIPQAKTVC